MKLPVLPIILIYIYFHFFLFRKYKVFTIVNPVGASKPPSYLHRWNSKSYTIEQGVAVIGSLSALAVTDNGNYVATGSMFDGTVEIYTTFNLAVSTFCLRLLGPIVLSKLCSETSSGLKVTI